MIYAPDHTASDNINSLTDIKIVNAFNNLDLDLHNDEIIVGGVKIIRMKFNLDDKSTNMAHPSFYDEIKKKLSLPASDEDLLHVYLSNGANGTFSSGQGGTNAAVTDIFAPTSVAPAFPRGQIDKTIHIRTLKKLDISNINKLDNFTAYFINTENRSLLFLDENKKTLRNPIGIAIDGVFHMYTKNYKNPPANETDNDIINIFLTYRDTVLSFLLLKEPSCRHLHLIQSPGGLFARDSAMEARMAKVMHLGVIAAIEIANNTKANNPSIDFNRVSISIDSTYVPDEKKCKAFGDSKSGVNIYDILKALPFEYGLSDNVSGASYTAAMTPTTTGGSETYKNIYKDIYLGGKHIRQVLIDYIRSNADI